MSAIDEVLENRDLVKLIVRRSFGKPDADYFGGASYRAYQATRLRSCLALALINRLFRSAADSFIRNTMISFEHDMKDFRDLALRLTDDGSRGADLWQKIRNVRHWPEAAYGLNLWQAFFKNGRGPERTLELDTFFESRLPETDGELLDLLEGKCVCCGARTPMVPGRPTPGAYALHPYNGQLVYEDHNDNSPRLFLAATCIPHTCNRHFFEVQFGHDATNDLYGMGLYTPYEVDSQEKRQFLWFIKAAKAEAWYTLNIARLFSLRSPLLRPLETSLVGANQRRFVTSICIYEPHLVHAEDLSLQSIFRLTRTEMRKMIRRGSAMEREHRLLM